MSEEFLDLAAIARTLRRSRTVLAAGALVGAIVAGGATAWLSKYRSEGVYTLGSIVQSEARPPAEAAALGRRPPQPIEYQFTKGITLQEFKTAYPQLDAEHFRHFLAKRGIAPDGQAARLVRLITAPQSRTDLLAPVYGATRADLRELGDQSKPVENLALAIQIVYGASSPDDATKGTRILGDFVGEALFTSEAASLLTKRREQFESRQLTLDNRLMLARFSVGTTGDKIKQLQAIRREFPDVADSAGRQVVSVADGGARYLSPNAQLVGLESTLAALQEEIAMYERARNVSRLLAAHYAKALDLASGDLLSDQLIAALAKTIDTSFASGGTDIERAEARNDALLDLQALRALREQGLRFASGPTEGWRDASRIWKAAAAGAAIGLLLVALIVLVARAIRDDDPPEPASRRA